MRDLAICEDTAISLSIGFPLGSITYNFLGALQVFTQLRYASILFWNSLEVRRLFEVCVAAHDVVIPLRFAVLLWINIELFCIRKPCFIFKRFLKLCKQCSQHITRGTTSLAWSAQRPNNCPNQECGPCGCTNFWLPRSFSNIEWLKWHIYSQLQQAISRHY